MLLSAASHTVVDHDDIHDAKGNDYDDYIMDDINESESVSHADKESLCGVLARKELEEL